MPAGGEARGGSSGGTLAAGPAAHGFGDALEVDQGQLAPLLHVHRVHRVLAPQRRCGVLRVRVAGGDFDLLQVEALVPHEDDGAKGGRDGPRADAEKDFVGEGRVVAYLVHVVHVRHHREDGRRAPEVEEDDDEGAVVAAVGDPELVQRLPPVVAVGGVVAAAVAVAAGEEVRVLDDLLPDDLVRADLVLVAVELAVHLENRTM